MYAHKCWALLKHCKTKDPKMKDILNNSKIAVPLANYIQATGRFNQDKKPEGKHQLARGTLITQSLPASPMSQQAGQIAHSRNEEESEW